MEAKALKEAIYGLNQKAMAKKRTETEGSFASLVEEQCKYGSKGSVK